MNKLKELEKKLEVLEEDDSPKSKTEFIKTCVIYFVASYFNIDDIEEARKKAISLLKKSLQKQS